MLRETITGVLLAFSMSCAFAQTISEPEKTEVNFAIGGKAALLYLPVSIAENLGYFEQEGLKVTIADLAGGSKALQALVGGSSDIVAGAYEHTIEMQIKGQPIRAFVALSRYSVYSLGISKDKIDQYSSIEDIKDLKVGVSAPGSGTNRFVNYLLAKEGIDPSGIVYIGVGTSASAVSAMRMGRIDAISTLDPAMTQLEEAGDIEIVVDGRTSAGSEQVYGGELINGVLYSREEFIRENPNTVRAVSAAIVKALKFMKTASFEELTAAIPPEYLAGERDSYLSALKKLRDGYSPDGTFSQDGVMNNLEMLELVGEKGAFDGVDISATFTNEFVTGHPQ